MTPNGRLKKPATTGWATQGWEHQRRFLNEVTLHGEMSRDDQGFSRRGGDEDRRIPKVRKGGAGLRVHSAVQTTGRGGGDRVLESSGTSPWLYLLPLAQSLGQVGLRT